MENVDFLSDRKIIETDKYVKIERPRKVIMKTKVSEDLFEKASRAIDEAVDRIEDGSLEEEREADLDGMFIEEKTDMNSYISKGRTL